MWPCSRFCDSVLSHMCLLMRITLCYYFLHKNVLCTFWWAHWWCSHGRATRGFAQVFADVGQQFVLWSIKLVRTFPSIKKCKVQRNRLIIYDAGLLAARLPLVGWSALFPVELCGGRVQVWCLVWWGWSEWCKVSPKNLYKWVLLQYASRSEYLSCIWKQRNHWNIYVFC